MTLCHHFLLESDVAAVEDPAPHCERGRGPFGGLPAGDTRVHAPGHPRKVLLEPPGRAGNRRETHGDLAFWLSSPWEVI